MFSFLGYAAAMAETEPALPWLHPLTLRAMQSAAASMSASGRSADAAAEAAREVALAHYPALPLPMIAEAVAVVLALPHYRSGAVGGAVSTPAPSGLRSGWSAAPALGFRPLAIQTLAFTPRNTRQPGASGLGP